jgi:hypothetical protein
MSSRGIAEVCFDCSEEYQIYIPIIKERNLDLTFCGSLEHALYLASCELFVCLGK